MDRHPNAVTFQGNPLTLVGTDVEVGQPAPAFTVVNGSLEPVSLADYAGKTVLISVVPSLDTGVCEVQTKRFETEAADLQTPVVTISVDLPFAQGRFCAAHATNTVEMLSDYQDRAFGTAYGVLIDELKLLTRAIFVVDPSGTLVYKEIVPEVTNHPDYDAALAAVKNAG